MNALGQQIAEHTVNALASFGFGNALAFAENVRVQVDAMQMQGIYDASSRRLEYNNPADDYSPSPEVENGAKIITEGGYYSNTPVPQAPVACLVLGLLAGFILLIIWFFRCCFSTLNCGPKVGKDGALTEEESAENSKKGFRIWISTIVFIVIVFLTDFIVFNGNSHFDQGVITINDCISTLQAIFSDLYSACITISIGANMMTSGITAADSCGTAFSSDTSAQSSMVSNIDTISKQMKTFASLIADPISQLDNGKSFLALYGQDYRKKAVMGVWAIVFIAILLLAISHLLKMKFFMKLSLVYSTIIYFLTVIFTFPFMIFTGFLGVFCLGPIEFIWSYIKVDILQFYTSCDSSSHTDLLGVAVDKAKSAFSAIDAILLQNVPSQSYTFGSKCPGLSSGNTMINSGFDMIAKALKCERIRDMMFKFFNEGVCVDIYGGLYSMWGSMFSTGFFLFFLLILASISYSYYDTGKQAVVPTANAQQGHYDEFGNYIVDQSAAEVEMAPRAEAYQDPAYNKSVDV